MTFSHFHALPPLLAGTVLLASCAASGPFPSLAPRAVERDLADGTTPVPPCLKGTQEGPATPTPPVPSAVPADPALPARIATLEAQAREGDRLFEEAIDAAAASVSAAGAARSESWIAAQQAVSRAEAARTPTADALSDLSALAVAAAERQADPADVQALQNAVDAVQAIADRQAARIGEVKAPLSGL